MEVLTAHLPPIIGDKRSTLQNQGVQSDLPDVHELLNGASTAGRSEPFTSDVRGRNSPVNYLEPLSKGRRDEPSPEPQRGRTVDGLTELLTRHLQQAMMDLTEIVYLVDSVSTKQDLNLEIGPLQPAKLVRPGSQLFMEL